MEPVFDANEVTYRRQGQQSLERRTNMAILLEWELTPPGQRNPKTRKALADSMGVTPRTLRNYANDRWFQVELAKRRKADLKLLKVPEVVDALTDIALRRWTEKGDPASASVSAAKVLLDWADRNVEELDIEPEDMTNDELHALLTRLKLLLEDA